MKNFSENRLFRTLLFFLIVGVIAKVIWLAISITFLPKSGIEQIEVSKAIVSGCCWESRVGVSPDRIEQFVTASATIDLTNSSFGI
jgi:hypothetical protein